MKSNSYDLKRHIKLLKDKNKSFSKQNQAEFLELIKYNAIVDRHIFWESRFEVALLIQTFLNKEISARDFNDRVFGLRRIQIEKCNKFLSKLVSGEVKEFFPNKESYKLKGFLSALYFECEHFEMNWDEKAFYNSIQGGFSKFQEILNEDS